MSQDHDSSYKQFFSYPRMVRDLLEGYVKEEWVKQLDFSSLDKVSGNFVSDDLRDRESDVIWRIKWQDQWLYLYLLLEFQSSVDPSMPVRMLTYLGLLYQDLFARNELMPGGKLPPVLPMVIYNGTPTWTAARSLSELISAPPAGLQRYQPQLSYWLIDESRLRAEDLPLYNAFTAIVRMENSDSSAHLQEIYSEFVQWLPKGDPDALRLVNAVMAWIRRSLSPHRFKSDPLPVLTDLHEAKVMLSERAKQWAQELEHKGRQEGKLEGLQEGQLKGLQEGQLKGKAATLGRLIRKRYHDLPEWASARLHSATAEQLDAWIEKLLEAPTLEALLA
jgi:predicted transposase YdaD